MQYVFGGPNWQINKQTNKLWLQPILCVCGLCGFGISFSGASNISALVNYMYTISTALTCTRGTQTGSLAKTLSAITPWGSRPVSRGISSYPIKETVKSPGEFSFRQLSRVLQEWRRAIFIRFPRGSHPIGSLRSYYGEAEDNVD